MYKVFVDQIPQTFNCKSEKDLLKKFSDHKLVIAAGGIVKGKDGYLFIKRNGLWDIPKGKLDPGESVEACAIREVHEECGINPPEILEFLCDTWHTYVDRKNRQSIKRTSWYLMKENGKSNPVPQTVEGITAVKFFKPKDFGTILKNTYPSIDQVLKRLKKRI